MFAVFEGDLKTRIGKRSVLQYKAKTIHRIFTHISCSIAEISCLLIDPAHEISLISGYWRRTSYEFALQIDVGYMTQLPFLLILVIRIILCIYLVETQNSYYLYILLKKRRLLLWER
jgi:hypothetical protein